MSAVRKFWLSLARHDSSNRLLASMASSVVVRQTRSSGNLPRRFWEGRRKLFSLPALGSFAVGCAMLVAYAYRKETQRAEKKQQKEKFNEKNRNKLGFFQATDTKGEWTAS